MNRTRRRKKRHNVSIVTNQSSFVFLLEMNLKKYNIWQQNVSWVVAIRFQFESELICLFSRCFILLLCCYDYGWPAATASLLLLLMMLLFQLKSKTKLLKNKTNKPQGISFFCCLVSLASNIVFQLIFSFLLLLKRVKSILFRRTLDN